MEFSNVDLVLSSLIGLAIHVNEIDMAKVREKGGERRMLWQRFQFSQNIFLLVFQ